MIFNYNQRANFGINEKLFLSDHPYMSVSRIGPLINDVGETNPISCGSVDYDKKIALKKAFSESIERRALLHGAKEYGTSKAVFATNILNNSIEKIPIERSRYNFLKPIIDTTGTSAHTNSSAGLLKCVSELFEKNNIFLFWYGKIGYVLEPDLKSKEKINQLFVDGNMHLFVIDIFKPLYTVIAIFSENSTVKFTSGVGSAFTIQEACLKSLLECYHLNHYYKFEKFRRESNIFPINQEGYSFASEDQQGIEYWIATLLKLEKKNFSYFPPNLEIEKGIDIKKIIPDWIANFYIICLNQLISSQHIVLKAYSDDLYSHIPKNNFIDVDRKINTKFCGLSMNDLSHIPQCIIL